MDGLIVTAVLAWPVVVGVGLWLICRRMIRRIEQERAERDRQREKAERLGAIKRTNELRDRGRITGHRPEHLEDPPSRNGTMRVFGTKTLPGDVATPKK